ncbi:MAG: amidohydrolase [Deltaproteobacteria bacterium]|nr:amidohydrolase [Deltaproteobacteria bacterium]
MIVDSHNHIVAKDSPYYIPQEEYLKMMDDLGVEKTVILGKDYGKLGDRLQSNLPDEEVADFVRTHPDRFIGFTAAHPDRAEKENLERIERAVNDLGLKGIKINPHAGFYPNDARLYPVYEKATELGIPVMFHTGIKAPVEGTRVKYCQPIYLDDVAVDFPDMIIIIAHAGYPWVEETILVGLYTGNVYADISTLTQIEGVMGFEVMMPTLRKLTSSWGAQRVLFGSDGIFNAEDTINAVKSADFLSESDKEKILGENAQKLLKI